MFNSSRLMKRAIQMRVHIWIVMLTNFTSFDIASYFEPIGLQAYDALLQIILTSTSIDMKVEIFLFL